MQPTERKRRGMILFDTVVGLTILAIAGIGWVTLLAQTRSSIEHIRRTEAHGRAANDLLERYRIMTQSELDGRIGTTRVGALTITVSPVAPHLYSLSTSDTGTQALLLSTTVYAHASADTLR